MVPQQEPDLTWVNLVFHALPLRLDLNRGRRAFRSRPPLGSAQLPLKPYVVRTAEGAGSQGAAEMAPRRLGPVPAKVFLTCSPGNAKSKRPGMQPGLCGVRGKGHNSHRHSRKHQPPPYREIGTVHKDHLGILGFG